MIVIPIAHITGIPIEETLAYVGPVFVLLAGATLARLSARVRLIRTRMQGVTSWRHSQ